MRYKQVPTQRPYNNISDKGNFGRQKGPYEAKKVLTE